MDFQFDQAGTRFSLSGRLTFAENDAFRQMVERLPATQGDEVVFDLAGMDFIDSAGLGMLLVAREDMECRGGRVRLRNAHGQVGRMLDLARFSDFFTVG